MSYFPACLACGNPRFCEGPLCWRCVREAVFAYRLKVEEKKGAFLAKPVEPGKEPASAPAATQFDTREVPPGGGPGYVVGHNAGSELVLTELRGLRENWLRYGFTGMAAWPPTSVLEFAEKWLRWKTWPARYVGGERPPKP